jgi:hypothetical protein
MRWTLRHTGGRAGLRPACQPCGSGLLPLPAGRPVARVSHRRPHRGCRSRARVLLNPVSRAGSLGDLIEKNRFETRPTLAPASTSASPQVACNPARPLLPALASHQRNRVRLLVTRRWVWAPCRLSAQLRQPEPGRLRRHDENAYGPVRDSPPPDGTVASSHFGGCSPRSLAELQDGDGAIRARVKHMNASYECFRSDAAQTLAGWPSVPSGVAAIALDATAPGSTSK